MGRRPKDDPADRQPLGPRQAELVARHHGMTRAAAWSWTRGREWLFPLLYDAAMDALIRCARKHEALGPGEFPKIATVYIRNAVFDGLRKALGPERRHLHFTVPLDDRRWLASGPDAEESAPLPDIETLTACLPDRERTAVLLSFRDGRSGVAIGRHLGLGSRTAQRVILRGLAILARDLDVRGIA